MDASSDTFEPGDRPTRNTVTIRQNNPVYSNFTGPVTFTDLDLKTYVVLVTKVFDGCRITLFSRKDRTRAYLIVEGEAKAASEDRLSPLIKRANVQMVPDGWERIRNYLLHKAKINGETVAVVIAEGKPPVNGEDSQLTWPCGIPANYGAGKEGDDGSVDYRERQSFVLVKAGDLLLQVTPPTKGEAGYDYAGKEIPAIHGEWKRPLAGANVRATNPSQTELYATIDGALSLDGERVHVRPMVEVLAVNFQSGNVRFNGDVSVALDVATGFEVVATGMAQIGGDVTQASVTGGHVFVYGRTVGSTLISHGKVEARGVENSCILADGDIVLLGDAVALDATCGGRLVMPNNRLAGGRINCIGGAEIGWLGGSTGDGTFIEVNPDAAKLPCIASQQEKIGEIEEQLAKIRPALEPIRRGGKSAQEQLPAKQRTAVIALLKKAEELEFALSVEQSSRKKLLDPILANSKAEIRANNGISAGTTVSIAGKSWTAEKELIGRHVVSLINDVLDARLSVGA